MKSLVEAGYSSSQLKQWRSAGRSCSGLILVTGVVGSGKSTSMKLFIETLPDLESKAINTVEDPIEYEIRGAHQTEVPSAQDEQEKRRRWGDVMRAMLRADPDGCFIGEIRDDLTAGFALQFSESGHLSMATLHAHLISNIVPRLTNANMGLNRQALTNPNILNLLVYQALVPVLCTACAETPAVAAARDHEVAELLDLLTTKFSVATENLRFKRDGGCACCKGRGTVGRTIVAEMWLPDRQWLALVRKDEDYAALLHYRSHSDGDLASENMNGKTVFEHALYKALHGQIDPRECHSFDSFERFEVLS